MKMKKTSSKWLLALSLGFAATVVPTQLMATTDKPNILVMWGTGMLVLTTKG